MHHTGHQWQPELIVCDFELAIILALETELPLARISGCYFHFCQSLWRRVQALGLVNDYKQNNRVQKFIQKIMAIGHLPVPLVRQNFLMFIQSRRSQRLINNHAGLHEFVMYVQNSYINGQFPVQLWNVYNRGHDCRTNNVVEGKLYMYIPI